MIMTHIFSRTRVFLFLKSILIAAVKTVQIRLCPDLRIQNGYGHFTLHTSQESSRAENKKVYEEQSSIICGQYRNTGLTPTSGECSGDLGWPSL